jgi:predicted DCC family thiol-disulfide oxidoreductase YuxK
MMNTLGPVIAYYDGLCPICCAEMRLYARHGDTVIQPHDCNGDLPPDVDRLAALAAIHVRLPNGRVVTGWDAFIAIWERLPGWNVLAALTRPVFIKKPIDLIYRWLAPYRPRKTCSKDSCGK